MRDIVRILIGNHVDSGEPIVLDIAKVRSRRKGRE
jgi:hypothetical protein